MIDRICAHVVPRAWRRARWSSPRSPVTSPADRGPKLVEDLEVEGIEHPGLGPLGQPTPASRRRAAAKLSGGQQPPRGGGAGHEHDRGQAGPVRNHTMSAAIRRAGRGWQQRFYQRPQLIRHQVFDEGRHSAGSCQTSSKGRAPAKLRFVPICPMTPRRGPEPRDRVVQAGGRFQRQACSGIWCRPRLCRGPGVGWPPWCGEFSPGIRRRPRRRCGSVQGSSPAASSPVTRFSTGSRRALRARRASWAAHRETSGRRARPCARRRRRPLVLQHKTTAAIPGRVSSPLTPGPALRAADRSHGRFGRPRTALRASLRDGLHPHP
jgi:hypothetical protein